jgi:hydroxymethylpyrimidine pyrophosphatase-like HAD family hydrolase
MSEQPRKTEREIWDELVTEFDVEYMSYGLIVHNQGRILYNMKQHLKRHGLDKERTGRWSTLLRERNIAESTAKGWVVQYQIKACVPPDKWFFPSETKRQTKIKISQQNRKKNPADSAVLPQNIASEARVEFADDADESNRDTNNRMVVECKFVLTLAEKLQLVEAIRQVGHLRATQLMFEGVVRAVFKGEGTSA